MAFNWKEWLPLIFGGATAGAAIAGTKAQKGALEKSTATQEKASQDAMKLLAGMWALQYNDQAPYRQAGQLALPKLLEMSGIKAPAAAGQPGAPPQGTAGGLRLEDILRNAGLGQAVGQPGPASGALASVPGPSGPGLGAGLGGTLAGLGTGAALSGAIPGIAKGAGLSGSLGSTIGGLAGPIGAGVGAVTGLLINRLGRAGRERRSASNAANAFSDWVWNDVAPVARKEQWAPQQLQQVIEGGKKDYSTWLSQNIKDTDVRKTSETSQFDFLNRGLQGAFPGYGR